MERRDTTSQWQQKCQSNISNASLQKYQRGDSKFEKHFVSVTIKFYEVSCTEILLIWCYLEG